MKTQKNIKKNTNYFFQFNFLLIFLFVFIMSEQIYSKCLKNTPILLKNGSCVLKYCTETEYINKVCIIDNEIIKTQWLNNIIKIGDKNFRYINIANYSNGDLIVETTAIPGSSKRMFYGIKNNGRGFFKNKIDNKMTSYYSIEAKDQTGNNNNQRLESEVFIATINGGKNNGKEYLVSIGKGEGYTELYDFENDLIYQSPTTDFLGQKMENLRGTVINYKLNNINFVILGYIFSSINYFYVKKFKFTSLDFIANKPNLNYFNNSQVVGKTLSCSMTDSNYIMCLYIYKNFNLNSINGYIKVISEVNGIFQQIAGFELSYVVTEERSFLKCIHYKEDIGIFIYYFYTYNFYNVKAFPQTPKILFKKIEYIFLNYKLSDYSIYFEETVLDQRKFNTDCSLNDLIKISDVKICFISTSDTKDVLYIVIINIIGTQN